jgi:hypothetical protein
MATPGITGGLDPEESKEARAIAESAQKLVHKAFASAGSGGQKLKNFQNGTWLGDPLHVILTDVPIGDWTTALAFDALQWVSGRDDFAMAADRRAAPCAPTGQPPGTMPDVRGFAPGCCGVVDANCELAPHAASTADVAKAAIKRAIPVCRAVFITLIIRKRPVRKPTRSPAIAPP